MAPKEKTPAQLRGQSRHLLYEIGMLYALLRYFETGEVDQAVAQLDHEGMPVRNAVIESYQLHARQLIEFLIDSPGKGSTAQKFTRAKWQVPTEQRELQKLEDEFSERVMHFGWKRSEFTDQERTVWTHQIEERIRPVLLRFLEQADPEKLCEGFVEAARAAIPGDTHKPEDLNVQRFDEIETRSATTEAPATNTRGTAIVTFPKPPEQPQ